MKIIAAIFLFFPQLSAGTAQVPARLNSYLEDLYKHHVVPGFSVVVIKDDKVFFSQGYGRKNNNPAEPFTDRTICSVGSLTKSLTATAVMQLVQEKKIDLDQTVVHYIPWFKTANKEKSDRITVRMLLDNTSGIYADNSSFAGNTSGDPLEEFVKSLAGTYLTRDPGNAFTYSNAGFSVAGLLIAKVSGLSYSQYLKQNIFTKLHMVNTSVAAGGLAPGKADAGNYFGLLGAIPAREEINPRALPYLPAGSMTYSNAADLGKYLTALLNDKSGTLLNQDSRQALWKTYITFPGLSREDGGDGSLFGYGLGWMISTIDGRKIIHHGGSTGKTSSYIMIDPQSHTGVCVLFNLDLSFIDKYRYKTEFNIVNNIRRLALGLPVSDYGLPLGADPVSEHIAMNKNLQERYSGEYQLKQGGDDWVHFGVSLAIRQGKNGDTEGIIYRGKQIVDAFKINWVNASLGISRNIALAEQIKFKITPEGVVNGLFFKNMEFTKIADTVEIGYRTCLSGDKTLSFTLPVGWSVKWQSNGFIARNLPHTMFLQSYQGKAAPGPADRIFFGDLPERYQLVHRESARSENINGCQWDEQIYRLKKGGDTYQAIRLSTRDNGSPFVIYCISGGSDFTAVIQKVMLPLINSVKRF